MKLSSIAAGDIFHTIKFSWVDNDFFKQLPSRRHMSSRICLHLCSLVSIQGVCVWECRGLI